MTSGWRAEGLAYAEDNLVNDEARHLQIDKKLVRRRFDLEGKRVLDFGCGTGGMTLWYATHWNCVVHGVDLDTKHIAVASMLKDRHGVDNVTFSRRNILEQPLGPEETFDHVFMNDVAEHIPLDDLVAIFRQLRGALLPGGTILVTYPPWRGPYASHVTHAVGIPWCQFLPDRFLGWLIEKNNHELIGELESDLLSAYHGLNRLTHDVLVRRAAAAGLEPVYRKSHGILNRLSALEHVNLNRFPLDFLVSKEFLELGSSSRRVA